MNNLYEYGLPFAQLIFVHRALMALQSTLPLPMSDHFKHQYLAYEHCIDNKNLIFLCVCRFATAPAGILSVAIAALAIVTLLHSLHSADR